MAKKKKKGGPATKASKPKTSPELGEQSAPAAEPSPEAGEQMAPAEAVAPADASKAADVYVVAPRRSVTSRRGLLVEGTEVKPGDFPGGQKDIVALVQKKVLVKKKG